MNPRFHAFFLALLSFSSALASAEAQTADEPTKIEKEAAEGKQGVAETAKGEPRDPTTPSPKLKELLFPEKAGKQSGSGPKMPLLGLRGRVVLQGQPAVALVEVDGKIFQVAKGSALPGSNNTMLRILDVTRWEVRIEVLPFKEIVILR